MLQQTQVHRVIPKYKEFLKAFPTVRALARAQFSEVLKIWSGLGYNRRAKYLHDATKRVVEKFRGKVPRGYDELRGLSGVGDYTAKAVRVFAFNEPDVLIETNIRTALIHHFFEGVPIVRTCEQLVYAEGAAKGQDPREWHSALMDYGSYLKQRGVRNNQKSEYYVKQSKFEGSFRQVRGAILRELMQGRNLVLQNEKYRKALAGLVRDGLIAKENGKWRIA